MSDLDCCHTANYSLLLSANTILREVAEELQANVTERILQFLGASEKIFAYAGQMAREIVMFYDGPFADPTLYEATSLRQLEGQNDPPRRTVWKVIEEFGTSTPVYPEGLLTLLEGIKQ
jgi:hypothetical protein